MLTFFFFVITLVDKTTNVLSNPRDNNQMQIIIILCFTNNIWWENPVAPNFVFNVVYSTPEIALPMVLYKLPIPAPEDVYFNRFSKFYS